MTEIEKLTLGPVIVSQAYVDWLSDPEVTCYLQAVSPVGMKSVQGYVEARQKDSIFRGIYLGTWHIGNIKAGPLDHRHLHADIGIMIGEKWAWGHGHGTEAIRQMVELCFNHYNLHMVKAGIIEGNISSQKAFLKNGFREIGRFPDFRRFEGQWVNEIVYGKVNLGGKQ